MIREDLTEMVTFKHKNIETLNKESSKYENKKKLLPIKYITFKNLNSKKTWKILG